MIAKKKINWKKIGDLLIDLGIIGVVLGGLAVALIKFINFIETNETENDEKIRIKKEFTDASSLSQGGLTYTIKTSESVIVSGGWNSLREYDFGNKAVFMKMAPDVGRVIQFSEFDAPEKIEEILQIGCKLAEKIQTSLVEFEKVNGSEAPEKDKFDAISSGFAKNYCMKGLK